MPYTCRRLQRHCWDWKKISFIAGGTDGCLANLGCAALEPGVAVITTGTSGAVRATIQNLVKGDMHGLFRYILTQDYYITGGAPTMPVSCLKWFADQFMPSATGNNIDDALLLAATVPAGSDGLLFLPYLLGERAPCTTSPPLEFSLALKCNIARRILRGLL